MSGLDADARLRRALSASALKDGAAITVLRSGATRWASATFTGARHELVLAGAADDRTERWLAALPDADLPLAGHLVADLKVVAVSRPGPALEVTLEALTVEEN